ncbi:hypothetical protein O6H91_11G034700 [Diphasiastrum complanatum]|uniref:Uncharacterized protein n=2 Tax=Diphasiastrum complanatum TaxID=34168 RepID=A0ACC2C7W2_DIPCM|nr:hypothetical protein O6H91_11G034700 [Diphasiastrum complanatum]KAJ7538113.1 hypothetical protein O6H91_11G034700 [Diphasiastrum complanatum]
MTTKSSNGDIITDGFTSNSYKRLKDKVCIITGAASGLGEATAHLFASHGASLVLADVQDELGREVAAKIGAQAIYVHCDVSIEADVAAMLDTCIRHFGRLDVLYNNAAILSNVGPLADMDISKFDVAHAVNVRGVALGLKYGARVMVSGGSIINTTSVAATLAPENADVAYTSSKHAVLGLMKAAAVELGQRGIRVNSVAPATMFTPMVIKGVQGTPLSLDMLKTMVEATTVLKVQDGLRVEDVADAALFFASDESRYVSGHNLVVDGGFSVRARTLLHPLQVLG